MLAQHASDTDIGSSTWVDLGSYSALRPEEAKEKALIHPKNEQWKSRVEENPESVLLQTVTKWAPKPVTVEQPPPRWKF